MCATRRPCASEPSGKRQVQSAMASSGSTEPEPSSTTSSPGAAIRSGPASAIGAALTRTVVVSRCGVERRAAVVADHERHLVGAGAGVGVADAAAGRGDAVAEAPTPSEVMRPSASDEPPPSKATSLTATDWSGPASATGAALTVTSISSSRRRPSGGAVVGDGQGHRIDAGRGPGVLHLRPLAPGAVAEVPGPGEDRAVGVGGAASRRGGAISPTAIGRVGADRHRHRRGVDGDRHRVGGAGVGDAEVVVDGQGRGVDAGRRCRRG